MMISLLKKSTNSFRRSIANAIRLSVMAAFVAVTFGASSAYADVVTDWNAIANTTVVANGARPAGAALVDMAYVHAAVYDAVNAIDGRYSVYAVSPSVQPSPDTSKEAAGATAAYRMLLALFPAQETFLTTKYTEYLATISEGTSKIDGINLGNEIATKFIDVRSNDGRNANITVGPWSGPGNWLPTPPNFGAPVTPWMATMRPFLIESPSQFRPDGPPALDSEQWAADYNETRQYGRQSGSLRTERQTEIGMFYTDHTGAQLSRIFRNFALGRQDLTVADDARLFAMLYLSIADSLIAGWDAKYHFHRWRPVTAIRAGETDGNDATASDPNWIPLATTPGHPEYPAAHGCLTAAYAEVLRAFFGTKKVSVQMSSTTTNTSHTIDNTDDLIKEIIDARVYGGMHFRTSVRDGANIGKKVTRHMLRNYFLPVE